MTFQTLGTVLGFLALIAPGLIYESGRRGARPEHTRSAFREAGEVAVASVGLVAAATVFTIVVTWRFAETPDLLRAVEDPGYRDETRLVLMGLGLCVLVCAWVFAGLGRWLSFRHHRQRARFSTDPVLWKELGPYTASGRLYVAVRCKSGRIVEGLLSSMDVGTDEDQPFIALGGVVVTPKGGKRAPINNEYQRVLLPMSDVEEMWMSARKGPDVDQSRASWLSSDLFGPVRWLSANLDTPLSDLLRRDPCSEEAEPEADGDQANEPVSTEKAPHGEGDVEPDAKADSGRLLGGDPDSG